MYSRLPVWAPSAVADPLFREVPKAVTHAEIDEIVAGYARGRRALRRGRVRRHRTAVQPQLDRARLPVARHQPPHRRVRRQHREPGAAAGGDRRRRAQGHRQPAGARRAHLRRRAHRGRHHHRRRGAHRQDRRGHRPGRLHQHLDRRRHGQPVHDRGEHAHPARVRDVHPVGVPQGGRPARGRRRPVQGPAAGRAGPRRGPLRPRRRGARPDRRPRLRRQGPRRRHRRHPPVPVVQPGVRRPHGPQPLARAASRTRAPAARPQGVGAVHLTAEAASR